MFPIMSAEFESVFARLRKILLPYSKALAVTQDTPRRFCLTGGVHPAHRTPMPVAWVEIAKNYVSFHHMGVYAFPKLRDALSADFQARMQGQSCFNFKTADEKLFAELEQITARGFAAFKHAGFLTGKAAPDSRSKSKGRGATK
jgi:hypothetical protein